MPDHELITFRVGHIEESITECYGDPDEIFGAHFGDHQPPFGAHFGVHSHRLGSILGFIITNYFQIGYSFVHSVAFRPISNFS